MKRDIYIDISTGGRGDIWMRLVGFYAMAELKPELKIHIAIPDVIRNLAKVTFADRLVLLDAEEGKKIKLKYSNLGILPVMKGVVLHGMRYISPFQKSVLEDRRSNTLKDRLNSFLFSFFSALGLIHIPPAKYSQTWHGFLEIVAIKAFRDISKEVFDEQVRKDYSIIFQKLNGEIPLSPELLIPGDIENNIVFFPNGTSRQFVPVDWAKQNYPDAYYALFHKDVEVEEFKKAGLKVIPYYKEPGDFIAIAKRAKWVITTDSFPSHILQSFSKKCTVLITEVLLSRVISPAFTGPVVNAEVACHPCPHMSRNVPCAAGHFVCLNWMNERYSENIKLSVSSN